MCWFHSYQNVQTGIHEQNPYLIPYGQQSKDHIVGWQEIQRVCLEANVSVFFLLQCLQVAESIYPVL